METTTLKWATIIGGLAAIGYFLETFAPLCKQLSCFKWGIMLAALIFIIVVLYYLGRRIWRKRNEVEQPEGPVFLESPFYIERLPIESEGYETIVKPSALIRIKAPRQMGKTSLMMRICHHAQQQGYRRASLSFDKIDNTTLAHLKPFLRWFCTSVTRELNLPVDKVAKHWNQYLDDMGNCSDYFEKELLAETTQPLVLAVDKVDRLFAYQDIAIDFFRLLRSWHEEGKKGETWSNLRLILVYTETVPISFKIQHSPFNVGIPLELPEFNEEQVETLVKQHKLNWTDAQVQSLMAMVGGHPYLIRLALGKIANQRITLEKLLQDAPTDKGLYRDHLRCLLDDLQEFDTGIDLAAAMKQVITSDEPIEIESKVASKLHNMGLIKLVQDNAVISRCDLYRRYFINRL